MHRRQSSVIVLVALLLAATLPLTPARARPLRQPESTIRYTFPASDPVFPEGIAYHAGNGDFFVGSTNDGAIYRGNAWGDDRQLQLFLPGRTDGRTFVTGMKVNPQGQLFVSGGATGMMWLYDAVTGQLLSAFSNGIEGGFINDVTIAPDGAAYFTDSRVPWIYRIKADAEGVYRFEFWLNLNSTAVEYTTGNNLNGIAATPDGRYLIAVQSNTGKLFRIATDTQAVREISLAGGDRMTAGDGIVLDGQTLYVARNSLNLIVLLQLTPEYSSGQQVGSFTDPSFATTTTIAKISDRLLVVNAQFNRRATNNPELPFTVSSVLLRPR
jgi:sugar lactone lactonase YvrE